MKTVSWEQKSECMNWSLQTLHRRYLLESITAVRNDEIIAYRKSQWVEFIVCSLLTLHPTQYK